jgi:hypothetical protein
LRDEAVGRVARLFDVRSTGCPKTRHPSVLERPLVAFEPRLCERDCVARVAFARLSLARVWPARLRVARLCVARLWLALVAEVPCWARLPCLVAVLPERWTGSPKRRHPVWRSADCAATVEPPLLRAGVVALVLPVRVAAVPRVAPRVASVEPDCRCAVVPPRVACVCDPRVAAGVVPREPDRAPVAVRFASLPRVPFVARFALLPRVAAPLVAEVPLAVRELPAVPLKACRWTRSIP